MEDESNLSPDASQEQPAEPVAPAPETVLDRREVIRQAIQNPENNRGKHAAFQPRNGGKFAGAPQFPVPNAPVRPNMPSSWKAEWKTNLQPHWESAAPELLNAIHEREADQARGFNQFRTQAQEGMEVLDILKPYHGMMQSEGATAKATITTLMNTAAVLRTGTPLQKAQAVAQVLQEYRIPLQHVYELTNGQAAPQAQPNIQNSQYGDLEKKVQQLLLHMNESQSQQKQLLENRALSVIEEFAADQANPHFEAVQDRMLTLLESPNILGDISNMNEREKLQVAYQTAIKLDTTISRQIMAQQQAKVQAQQGLKTAKLAAVQVNGAPGSSAAPIFDINNRRSVIANALRKAQH